MAHSITSMLGVHGLKNLDTAILSALATNSTVLLIGPHGSAKTMLAQKAAGTLKCTFRHYNTSLLNYDDLVGYPVPDRENRELHFIQTPGTIWDAEFVLFDEISRARPEIRNKVFPIVHEHRIQGIELPKLSHCWAAMNPPSDGEDENEDAAAYSGSWSLDVALADRFRFVLRVPGFNELDVAARGEILQGGNGGRAKGPTLKSLVAETRKQMRVSAELHKPWAVRYVSFLTPLLEKASLPVSGRRARFLLENLLALFSAEQVLAEESDIMDAALRALFVSLPHSAAGKAVDQGKLLLAHKQASEDAGEPEGSVLLRVKTIRDPVQRVESALREKLDRVVDDPDRLRRLRIAQRHRTLRVGVPGVPKALGGAEAQRGLARDAGGCRIQDPRGSKQRAHRDHLPRRQEVEAMGGVEPGPRAGGDPGRHDCGARGRRQGDLFHREGGCHRGADPGGLQLHREEDRVMREELEYCPATSDLLRNMSCRPHTNVRSGGLPRESLPARLKGKSITLSIPGYIPKCLQNYVRREGGMDLAVLNALVTKGLGRSYHDYKGVHRQGDRPGGEPHETAQEHAPGGRMAREGRPHPGPEPG